MKRRGEPDMRGQTPNPGEKAGKRLGARGSSWLGGMVAKANQLPKARHFISRSFRFN
jgi:hypothetical protein